MNSGDFVPIVNKEVCISISCPLRSNHAGVTTEDYWAGSGSVGITVGDGIDPPVVETGISSISPCVKNAGGLCINPHSYGGSFLGHLNDAPFSVTP